MNVLTLALNERIRRPFLIRCDFIGRALLQCQWMPNQMQRNRFPGMQVTSYGRRRARREW